MSNKILIVDDEPHIRFLLEQALEDLEDLGVELLLAADGEGALELVRNERPELVLLDVMMPRLSGYKVCEQIKAIESGIYVILLTAKGQALDKVRGREAGADEYVTKPFDPDYVVERAVKVLGLDF